jgi:hypothetical protein
VPDSRPSLEISDDPTVEDQLGFNAAAELIASTIAKIPMANTPWTVGIFGEWGSGKTSFLKMVDMELSKEPFGIRPIWFNAWKYSREENLWSALLQTVLDQVRVSGPAWRRPWVALRVWFTTLDVRAGSWEMAKKLTVLAIRLALVAVGVALFYAAAVKSVNPIVDAVARAFPGQQTFREAVTSRWGQATIAAAALLVSKPDFLWKIFDTKLGIDFSKFSHRRSYREKIAFLDEFNAELRKLLKVASRDKPIVIVIDDLDRCLPEQTLQILESVKLFLDVRGCVFLLAVDRDVVERAIATKYKDFRPEDMMRLGETYFEKVVQLALALPPTPPDAAKAFLRQTTTDPDAHACAPILIAGPAFNPRRVKRNLQTFLFLKAFADGSGRALVSPVLAKLVIIQAHYRQLYREALENDNLLASLEHTYRRGGDAPGEPDNAGAPDGPADLTVAAGSAEQALRFAELYPSLPPFLRAAVSPEDTFQGIRLSDYLSFFRAVVGEASGAAAVEPDRESAQTSVSPSSRPWMLPPTAGLIDRPELTNELVRRLTDARATAQVVALVGAGGFGKTTAAMLACGRHEVLAAYPGGLLWCTLSRDADSASLAQKINDLISTLGGDRPNFVDPMLAGFALGELLDRGEPVLLVIDDVWTSDQLDPFLLGGSRCCRLVTTRNAAAVPDSSSRFIVDTLSRDESAQLLHRGLPSGPPTVFDPLLRLTGEWPLLIALANNLLRRRVARGVELVAAVDELVERLRSDGPASFDQMSTREPAVRVTMQATMELLSNEDQDRFYKLAVFPEGVVVPIGVVQLLWRLDGPKAVACCERLHDHSLVGLGERGVTLHRAIQAYLRAEIGPERFERVNGELVDALKADLPAGADPLWWRLPAEPGYWWSFLPYHLRAAGRPDQAEALLHDIGWIGRSLAFGPNDLAAFAAQVAQSSDPHARLILDAVMKDEMLLTLAPPTVDVADLLCDRLVDAPELGAVVERYERRRAPDRPRVRVRWPRPGGEAVLGVAGRVSTCLFADADQILAATTTTMFMLTGRPPVARVLTIEFVGSVVAVVHTTDDILIATAAGDRTVVRELAARREIAVLPTEPAQSDSDQVVYAFGAGGRWLARCAGTEVAIWDLADAARPRVTFNAGHAVTTCVAGPTGTWLLTGGPAGHLATWNTATGHNLRSFHVDGAVLGGAIAPDERWLAATTDAGGLWVSGPDAEHLGPRLDTTARVTRACAASPDGRWLATADDDGTVTVWRTDDWQVAAATSIDTEDGLTTVAWSPDSAELCVGGDRGLYLLSWQG